MKMILSAIVTLSAVAAFAAPAATTSSTTTTTTAPAATHEAAPAATHEAATTTTTTKEAKVMSKGMTKADAEKACAKDANKDACVKKHMTPNHTM